MQLWNPNQCLGDFIPQDEYKGKTIDWYQTDSLERYQSNLKYKSDDWIYRNQKISYQFNSRGYREQEFDQIDWANSIVIFGCSNVLGVGLALEHTIAKQLGRMSGRPVVNMGVGATSMEFSVFNSSILRQQYTRPWGVVHFWTAYERNTVYRSTGIEHHGAWSMKTPGCLQDLTTMYHDNMEVRGRFLRQIAYQMWLGTGVRYCDATAFTDTARYINCPLIESLDFGRDNEHGSPFGHPGPKTAQLAAKTIWQDLKER